MAEAKQKKEETTKKHIATIDDYQKVFGSERGKKVLRHMMRISGFLSTSHVNNDPYSTAFNEGMRSMVIQIIKKTKIDIKDLEERLQQNQEDDDVFI